MSRKMRMYNVEFGDSFLLYGQNENLLVDLGSIQKYFNFEPVRESVMEESRGKQLSLLLTHFHKDHWAGLKDQPPHSLLPIQKIYIPDIFQMRVFGKLDVVIRSLLGDFLDAVLLEEIPRYSLADLLREVLPGLPKERICLLERGSVFQAGGRSYEVLWPRLEEADVAPKRNKALLELIERLEAKLSADGAKSRLWDTLEGMANALLAEFAELTDSSFSKTIRIELRSYEEMQARADQLAGILTNDLKRNDKEFRQRVSRHVERLKRDWNRVSLVFQERGEKEGPNGVLMTGDVPVNILEKLINGGFGAPHVYKSYGVIKAPHHGTKTHFCNILPRSQYLCVSNGEGSARYGEIAQAYEHVYGCLGKKITLRCTNPRCEFYALTKDCPYFGVYPVEDYYDIIW